MNNIPYFCNVKAVDVNGKDVEGTAFNLDLGMFQKVDANRFDKISEGRTFKVEDGRCLLLGKSIVKEIIEDTGRNPKTMKLLKPLSEIGDRKYLLLVKPHNKFFNRKPVESSKRYVMDPFTGEFILIAYSEYKKMGLDKLKRGTLVFNSDGEWIKISGRNKFAQVVDEINMWTAINKISENVLFWTEGSTTKLCNKCVNKCKQNSIVTDMICPQFKKVKNV